jgi:glutamyl-tRNA(Gln) amidotransferase subunit E
MKGLFGLEVQPNKDFGLDIFEKSMLITGISREDHFHSDEMEIDAVRKRSAHPCRLPIDDGKYLQICSMINLKPEDAYVVVAGPERRVLHALKKIVERVKMALDGVPQETRRLLPNGNTEFLRVIHGKERIYPDTDTPPIAVPEETVEECRKMVGERPWEIYDDLHRKYNFDQHQVELLIRDEKVELLCDYIEKLRLKASVAYRLLIELPRSKRRKGITIDNHIIDQLAKGLSNSLIIPEQIDFLIEIFAQEPNLSIQDAVKKLQISRISERELDNVILNDLSVCDADRIRSDQVYRRLAVPRIVGAVLKDVDYSVPGKKILEKVNELINEETHENAERQ